MKIVRLLAITYLLSFMQSSVTAQSWVDSVERHGREIFMPADKYKWDWGQATFLNSLVHLYNAKSSQGKKIYLDYIQKAMEVTYDVANGKHPNAIASAHGMAFLAKITGEKKYLDKCNSIYADFLKIPRAPNGGVSHRAETTELWDDTIYMISMFLLEMYRLTGDEKYIADFVVQFNAHNEKLADEKSGLWVHGWDADSIDYNDGCSIVGWPDKITRKSSQIWARGNAWVGMALADALNTVPHASIYWETLVHAFKHYVEKITPLQNKITGHWYQLVAIPNDPQNWEESSSTAMFAYTITVGLQLKILDKKTYLPLIDRAYKGLRSFSLKNTEGAYLIPSRICGGTCVGDKAYYLSRNIVDGTGFGYGSFIMFGLAYELYKGMRK